MRYSVDDIQMGFTKGKGTTDAIFIVRQMQEKFRAKGKKLYFGFVDLERAFDRVPREVIQTTSTNTDSGALSDIQNDLIRYKSQNTQKDGQLLSTTDTNTLHGSSRDGTGSTNL